MVRVVLAPCSPFSVTADLMRESAALARAHGVSLHTHLAETLDEERFCLETFGHRPLAYAESLDWAGGDVWFAHAVHILPDEVSRMAASGTGVAHCPTSNMRLSSGIAPLRRYRRRWRVERLLAWLQNFRRLVTRYEYHATNFLGFVQLGCIVILLRHL